MASAATSTASAARDRHTTASAATCPAGAATALAGGNSPELVCPKLDQGPDCFLQGPDYVFTGS
jgi:hypothetical protein